jgi:Family of unknown function (DUF5317)
VILLASIPIGVVFGYALGGHLERLGEIRFAWAPLAIVGLLVQVALFTPLGGAMAGGLEPALYVASTAAVFVAVVRNHRLTGMPIVALGALSNLVAVIANGGAMPADPAALAAAGLDGPGTYTNSVVVANPVLRPLTDIFAIPAGVPLANVFSVGDVLIGLGIVAVIAAAMRRRAMPGLIPE